MTEISEFCDVNDYRMTANNCYDIPSNTTVKADVKKVVEPSSSNRLIACLLFGVAAVFALTVIVLLVSSVALYLMVRNTIQDFDDLKNTEKIMNIIKYGISIPPSSCSDILEAVPNSPSGYYKVKSHTGTDIYVYCDMTRSCGNRTGGWMRVVKLDMTDSSAECPPGLCLNTTAPRTCRICNYEGTCSLDTYFVGTSYSRVCGRIIGYQIGTPDGFDPMYANGVDGIILTTYGNQMKNIWTFAVATNKNAESDCPCVTGADARSHITPNSTGTNYFCDTAASQTNFSAFYTADPLWDGAGCEGANTCCTFNNPPWFYVQLSHSATDDIQMEVCRNGNRDDEDISIQILEIYAQ